MFGTFSVFATQQTPRQRCAAYAEARRRVRRREPSASCLVCGARLGSQRVQGACVVTEGLRGAGRTRAGGPNGVVQHRGDGDLSQTETLQDTLWPKAGLEAEMVWEILRVGTHQEPWAKAGSQGWSSGRVPMHRGRPQGEGWA